MPEGKSTHDLISSTPTSSATSIYADWDDMMIDGASDVDPWVFDNARFHPLLTYGGQTATISGNQLFVNGGISSRYGGDTTDPKEGMTLYANRGAYNAAFRNQRSLWTVVDVGDLHRRHHLDYDNAHTSQRK